MITDLMAELRKLRNEALNDIKALKDRLRQHYLALSNCCPSYELGRQSEEFQATINKHIAEKQARIIAIDKQIDRLLGIGIGVSDV